MRHNDVFLTALNGVTVNKTRTFLTMLGIGIGVGSVILMVSIGRSFEGYILSQIESFGSRMVEVYPAGLEKFGGNLDTITMDDLEMIERLPTVESITPIIMVSKTATYGREEVSPEILGAKPAVFGNYGFELDRGRLLEDSDVDGAKNVAVLTDKIVEDLFGNRDPIGKRIDIGGQSFTVVGTLAPLGSGMMSSFINQVFIPFTTARILTGQRYLTVINMIAKEEPSLVQRELEQLMREQHNIDNPDEDPDLDDFRVRTAEQILGVVSSVTMGLTIFLAVIAAISLLVGGIGIMNIMLVSVTERTREIGLRKAVGARKKDILVQFLIEAVSLTLSGGVAGIIGGIGLGWLLSRAADKALGGFSFVLSPMSIVLAVSMAAATGLMFGLYPAKRASDLSPMEALRRD